MGRFGFVMFMTTMTVGCARVGETPMSMDMTIQLPGAEELGVPAEGIPEGETVSHFVQSDPIDLTASREQIPRIARGVIEVDALEMFLDSPEFGNIGSFISQMKIYVSEDDALSDNDVIVGNSRFEPEDDGLDLPLGDDVDALITGADALSILIDIELHDAPEEPVTLPVGMDIIGYLKVL